MTEQVRQLLVDLHSTWPKGDMEALVRFYHQDVVMLPPDLGRPIIGRDAVVLSYQEFLQSAQLHDFTVTSIDVYSFANSLAPGTAANTHVAHLYFDILYSLDGERFSEQGLEVYTIIEDQQRTEIVWRSQMVLDSERALSG
ncbi:MAG: nuclear transport factor 2 family protein [Pseudomonadales bacterium]